jgi:pimeloyl-ACP methyl ester carboxylesterase
VSRVQRRTVFYVSGFDPKGASHYHAMYREQCALQSALNGLVIEVGPRQRDPTGNWSWTLDTRDGQAEVHTHYEFMRWDDIVRSHWPKSTARLWHDIAVTTIFNLRCASLWRMFKLSWPPAVALFAPFALLCAVIVLLPLLSAVVGGLVFQMSGGVAFAAAGAAITASMLGWLAWKLQARYSMYWLMRSYAFTARQGRNETPDLEARLDLLADRVRARIEQAQDDEVLVVGHSSGAMMAISILARALRRSPESSSGSGPRIALLTLGQWIPLLGLLPGADRFRRELRALASAPALTWIDFSAPPDGCCFALVDPLSGSGVSCEDALPDRPKLLSPRFAAMFGPSEYQALRKDKFRMHFQYLMASAQKTEYDYFAITAGAVTLGERFQALEGVKGYSELRPFS